jgi:hypothetical protein
MHLVTAHVSGQTSPSIQQTIRDYLPGNVAELVNDLQIINKDNGKLSVDLIVNIGNCWGKERLARKLAKQITEKLFGSGLPISEVKLKVISNDVELLVLAIGHKPAQQAPWHLFNSGTDFIQYLKTRHIPPKRSTAHEDYAYVIENHFIYKPSPLLDINN